METRLQTHDQFFKYLLSDLDRARVYLRTYLSEALLAALDLETLKLEDGSFVDDQLKNSHSDLIFSVATSYGKPANLCFLLEHKSNPDRTTVFQILHYISSAMLRRVRNRKELQLIIPILFYHGEKTWTYKPLEAFFTDLPAALRPYLPTFEYLYHNFNTIPDREIRSIPDRLLASAILVMKHHYDLGYLTENASFLLLGGYDEQGNFNPPLLVYFFSKIRNKKEEVVKIFNTLPSPVKSTVMNALEMFREEGIAKGIEQGIKQGIEQGMVQGIEQGMVQGIEQGEDRKNRAACANMIRLGFEDKLIIKVLEVTPEFVQTIRQELAEKKERE